MIPRKIRKINTLMLILVPIGKSLEISVSIFQNNLKIIFMNSPTIHIFFYKICFYYNIHKSLYLIANLKKVAKYKQKNANGVGINSIHLN